MEYNPTIYIYIYIIKIYPQKTSNQLKFEINKLITANNVDKIA